VPLESVTGGVVEAGSLAQLDSRQLNIIQKAKNKLRDFFFILYPPTSKES
jgi:hypothetical protein